MTDVSSLLDRVRAWADQCVLCGACLQSCPTYALARRESMGPRGRIALLRAIADAEHWLTPPARVDLQACLGCLRCESVCPARVRYGALMDTARARWLRPGTWLRLALAGVVRPALMRVLLQGVRWMRLPMRVWRGLGGHGRVHTTAALAPVRLWTGCSADTLEPRAVDDFLALSRLAGLHVGLDRSGCCGALHRHAGLPERAQTLASRLLRRWRVSIPPAASESEWLRLSWADACGQHLQDKVRGVPVRTALEWWLDTGWPRLRWQPAQQGRPVALWVSCQMRGEQLLSALRSVPAMEVRVLRGLGCCGAVGFRHLLEVQASLPFADAVLDEALAAKCAVLVVTQPGCLHALRSRAVQRRLPLQVVHLWSWLRQQHPVRVGALN